MNGLRRVCLLVANFIILNARYLSIKNLTVTTLVVIAGFSVLLSFVSGEYFFKAAREAQLFSLQRVIQVATREIMQELHDQTYDVATALSINGAIPREFSSLLENGDKEKYAKILDDPFITGFVGAYVIELVKVRVYDLQLNLVAESNKGIHGLSKKMPKELYHAAYGRAGTARSKAVFALWQHADKSYYSVLVPLGGIFVSGYLEIVVNPVINLVKISEKMDSPVSIRSGINPDKVYYSPTKPIETLLPIEYTLWTDSGAPAYLLTSYENIAKLSEGVRETVFNTILIFVAVVIVVLLISIGLFQRLVFNPMQMMLKQIRLVTDGDISRDLKVNGVAEIAILAEEFNKMAREVRYREDELMRLSVIDGLTQIANRRKFDEVLNREYYIGCRTGRPLSILMIDIDYFKLFNDTYGHLAGDNCLQRVAVALEASVCRPTDLVARYGGEEFAIILADTPENGENVVAEKILKEIAALDIDHEGSKVSDKLTVSIGGYTLKPAANYDPPYVVAEADKSLYQAKGEGRNRFVLRSES